MNGSNKRFKGKCLQSAHHKARHAIDRRHNKMRKAVEKAAFALRGTGICFPIYTSDGHKKGIFVLDSWMIFYRLPWLLNWVFQAHANGRCSLVWTSKCVSVSVAGYVIECFCYREHENRTVLLKTSTPQPLAVCQSVTFWTNNWRTNLLPFLYLFVFVISLTLSGFKFRNVHA